MRCQLDGGEDGGGSVGTSDDSERGSLLRGEAYKNAYDEHAEDAHLGGGTHQHQLRLGDQGGEVGHRTYAKENQRRIPALLHSLVEYVQHRTVLVYAYVQAREHRDVAHYDSEADRHEQQRLPFLDYAQGDEDNAYGYHHHVLYRHVGEAGVLPELYQ